MNTNLLRLSLSIVLVAISANFALADDSKKAPAGKATADKAAVTKITILGTDQMKFNLSEIKVKKGAKIELTMKHDGKLPVNVMGHNFVLLKQGVDLAKFAMEAMKGKDSGYVLPSQSKDVIAKTDLVGGGASTTITFDAPAPGTYDFLCTFPGHYAMMKGKFIVE
jgi:azurin